MNEEYVDGCAVIFTEEDIADAELVMANIKRKQKSKLNENLKMKLLEFFDIKNEQHLLAFQTLHNTGQFPEEFYELFEMDSSMDLVNLYAKIAIELTNEKLSNLK